MNTARASLPCISLAIVASVGLGGCAGPSFQPVHAAVVIGDDTFAITLLGRHPEGAIVQGCPVGEDFAFLVDGEPLAVPIADSLDNDFYTDPFEPSSCVVEAVAPLQPSSSARDLGVESADDRAPWRFSILRGGALRGSSIEQHVQRRGDRFGFAIAEPLEVSGLQLTVRGEDGVDVAVAADVGADGGAYTMPSTAALGDNALTITYARQPRVGDVEGIELDVDPLDVVEQHQIEVR